MTLRPPSLRFRNASSADAPELAALHNAVSGALIAKHGAGHWAGTCTEHGCAQALKHAVVRVGCMRIGSKQRIVTTLRLAQKKPWAIDVAYFTPVKRALYLTSMATSVAHQCKGFGTQALNDAREVARAWPAQAIRLDAFDAKAGAGGFYAACGMTECGRVKYRGTPLIFFEILV